MNEKELLKGCRKKKLRYQKALYERYAPTMLGVCFRYFSDIDKANDVLQDVFIKVFENISKFREEGSLEGWIRRITVHTSINEIKKRKREMVELDESQLEAQDPNLHDEDTEYIINLVSELPDNYREIFNLVAIEGYSFKETSELLETSEGNVRVRYHRARKKLQELLNAYYTN